MIIAVTCTGGRPYQFALCEKYMARQTVKPNVWLVVDDGASGPDAYNTAWHSLSRLDLHPKPSWSPDFGNSQHRNWLRAIDEIENNTREEYQIIVIEDDDWYAPNYIEKQTYRLQFADLVGQSPARYWNTKHQCYRIFEDAPNPSLAATAFTAAVIPLLREILQSGEWIDSTLWSRWNGSQTIYPGHSVVGIKGMPGRPGVSAAHRNEPGPGWVRDPGGRTLRQWIGDDADAYLAKIKPEPKEKPRGDDAYGLKWFVGIGDQIRYRCPSCALDDHDPHAIKAHWEKEHQPIEEPMGRPTLFDADNKPITKRIHVPR